MTFEGRESLVKDKDATNNQGDDMVIHTKNETTDLDKGESADASHTSLKYSLLGPSLTKAGQDLVDQSKVGPARNAARIPVSGCFDRPQSADKPQLCLLNIGIRDYI